MANQHFAVFRQLILVVINHFARTVIRLILERDNFQRISEAGDIHVGALVISVIASRSQPRTRIDWNSYVIRVSALTHMNVAHGSADIHLLILPVLLFFHIHAAGGQNRKQQRHQYPFSFAHAETLFSQPVVDAPDPRPFAPRSGLKLASARGPESPRTALLPLLFRKPTRSKKCTCSSRFSENPKPD